MSWDTPSEYAGFDSKTPSPQDVNAFHQNSDKDSSPYAQHHTLGGRPNQAAPGDHKHSDGFIEYTPELQSGTVGSGGSLTGRYIELEDGFIHFEARLILGTGFVFNSSSVITTPSSTAPLHIYGALIKVVLVQSGSNLLEGFGILFGSGVACYYKVVSGSVAGWIAAITTTAPFVWKATDEVIVSGVYRQLPE